MFRGRRGRGGNTGMRDRGSDVPTLDLRDGNDGLYSAGEESRRHQKGELGGELLGTEHGARPVRGCTGGCGCEGDGGGGGGAAGGMQNRGAAGGRLAATGAGRPQPRLGPSFLGLLAKGASGL